MERLCGHVPVALRRPLSAITSGGGASVAVRLMLAAAAIVAAVVSSVALYAAFYKLYVPLLLHQAPVHLQYPPQGFGNTTATVSFVPKSNYKFLSTSQAYTVSLDLDVPTSDANRQIGNFMVFLELCDRRARAVHRSARPSILPYQSLPVRLLATAVRAVPLALGLSREATRIHIPLLEEMYDAHFSPVTSARIALSQPLQVYSAQISIRAQFAGLRYWMYYWRLPTSLLFIASAVVCQLVFAAISWSVLESYAQRTRTAALPAPTLGDDDSEPQTQPSSAHGSPIVRAMSFFDHQHGSGSRDQNVPDSADDLGSAGLGSPLLSLSRRPSSQSLRRRVSGRQTPSK
ncbi:hypothetical protein GGF46_003262 [Coemansia sp. RSA 552]|nr:hypothetical protein GGF46_003262 [Coemansia sp. RSA 552]